MNTRFNAKPQLTLLTIDQIEQVHRYALHILATTGIRVDSPGMRALLAQQAGLKADAGDIVRLPGDLVGWALKQAPGLIDIYNRSGELTFRLGEGRLRFGIGVTTLYYQDPLTDELTPFTREHMRQMVRLGQRLPLFDVISTVGVVQDVPPQLSDLYASLEMIANTTKPLVILISDEHKFPHVLELLEHLHGDLGRHPFVIPYFNPVTPLVMNAGTLDKMQSAIQRGLPVIFSNYSMAGMSTPITPAGTLAVLLAELLAGLTLSQLIKEGAPVILGILPAFFDMKTMVNFYDPQSMLLNLACAEIMAYYGLPHCGTSGSGTGWGPDLLAAETYWMNHLTYSLMRGGLAPFVGDTLTSKAFSPTNTVYVHEIIDQALRFAQGFQLDDEVACLDEIHAAGPGGNFLLSPSTLRDFRNAYYSSPIFPRWSMEKWVEAGRLEAIKRLREYTQRLLDDLQAPEDCEDLLVKGEEFIRRI